MQARSARLSVDQWKEIVDDFHHSGLGARTFCAQRGLAISTFSRWRRHVEAHGNTPPRSHFIEAVSSQQPHGVVTLRIADQVAVDCPISLGVDRIAELAQAVAHRVPS